MVSAKPNSKSAIEQLQLQAESILNPLGYEVVTLALNPAPGRARTYTLYIDFLNNSQGQRKVGLDDCITVNKAVDELFETTPLLEGQYTLEVSSPGVERPLTKPEDYSRFSGRKARIHTFRPLETNEMENNGYWTTHTKQKNFSGQIDGLNTSGLGVHLRIENELICIPLALISKAHLEFSEPEESVSDEPVTPLGSFIIDEES
jgi:ribosome maturation factor RimP